MSLADQLKFDRNGLVPAIIRDVVSGEVLLMTFMNAEAVRQTVATNKVHHWSRSQRRLRMKGETSGEVQTVREIRLASTADCLLISVEQGEAAGRCVGRSSFGQAWDGEQVRPVEPGTGRGSHAGDAHAGDDILAAVFEVIRTRRQNPTEASYVSSLFQKGLDKILGKIGEEATETAVAGKGGKPQEVIYETADLFFHTLVLLAYYDIPPEHIYAELRRRFGLSGLAEKASRGK